MFIAVPFVFSRSRTSHVGASTQNASRIKRFSRLHIVIKPLNKKNKHNKLFIMLKSNCINVHCKFGARQKWEPAGSIYRWFWKFFERFRYKPTIDRPEYWLSAKIVKYCILSEVCKIYSTVSPQMWCIKTINRSVYTPPDLLSRFCKVNLLKAKDSAWFVFQEFVFEVLNILWSRAIMALECDRRLLLFFACKYKAINSM